MLRIIQFEVDLETVVVLHSLKLSNDMRLTVRLLDAVRS